MTGPDDPRARLVTSAEPPKQRGHLGGGISLCCRPFSTQPGIGADEMKSNLIDLEARLMHETEKARRFDFGGSEPIWLPKSAHEWDPVEHMVTLPEPLAIEKGLI